MSVIAEFSVPASEFVIGEALQAAPGLSVEIERVVPTGSAAIPYFWVAGEGRSAFDSVLETDDAISSFAVVDELDGRWLYRVEWEPHEGSMIRLLIDHDAVLQEANGDGDTWSFQLRFPGSHELSEFHTAAQDADVDVTVEHLYNPVEPALETTTEMTDPQRELVEQAYDLGYFDIPRGITLSELAEKLGISDQAVNERMRRGLSALVERTLKSD